MSKSLVVGCISRFDDQGDAVCEVIRAAYAH